jgi:hypothetical protein
MFMIALDSEPTMSPTRSIIAGSVSSGGIWTGSMGACAAAGLASSASGNRARLRRMGRFLESFQQLSPKG